MELAFDHRKIRDVCENNSRARRTLGDEVARKLYARLADIDAAATIEDLLIGGLGLLNGQMNGSIVVPLGTTHTLHLVANHHPLPTTESGKADWGKVFRLKVLEIRAIRS